MGSRIREYLPEDETLWLRCRALAFLGTSYFDAVYCSKPVMAEPRSRAAMRAEFSRVHVCRRFVLAIAAGRAVPQGT
jgi:hypothetical protein